jgi:tetratricopeptide (TPR) repeat protein
VREGRYQESLALLATGERLEPNPHFLGERAQAYVNLHDYERALECYEKILTRGQEVPDLVRATALRQKGFILIESGELDSAEDCYRESLRLGPRNKAAKNQSKYIADLRSGGWMAPTQMIDRLLVCDKCGRELTDREFLRARTGRSIHLCKGCFGKQTKKRWQFCK